MTRDDIAARIRFNLNDAGVTFYSASDVNNSIQDGYDEVVALSQTIEKVTTLSWVSQLVYYNFRNLVTDFIRPIAIFDNNNNRWLEHKSLPFLQAQRQDFETIAGAPFWYCVMDFTYTAISPRLETATGTFDFLYKANAATLAASDVPVLPDSLTSVLELYGTADLLEQAEEYEKAGRYWYGNVKLNQLGYFDILDKIKKEVRNRESPDRYHTLREQYLQANLRDATLVVR